MRTAILFPLLLAACGAPSDKDDVDGVTPGEAQALNDAAAMLDANAIQPVLVTPESAGQTQENGAK